MIDFVHACEEYEDVSGGLDGMELLHGSDAAFDIISAGRFQVVDIYGIAGPSHTQDGDIFVFVTTKEVSEVLGIDCGGSDDEGKVAPFPQHLLEQPHDDVHLSSSLVRFVQHDYRIALQERVPHEFANQDALGEILDLGSSSTKALVKADAVANLDGDAITRNRHEVY